MDAKDLMSMVMSQAKTDSEQNPKGGTPSSEHKKKMEEKFYEAFKEDAEAQKAEKAKRLREESNLGARFARRTFENFDADRDRNAYEKCLTYSEQYKDTERNCLLLVGSYGSGKTHLAGAIANKLMDKGVPVLFDTFSGHLNKLKMEFNGGKSVYLEQMKNVDMLILDDIGKEKITEWSQSIMFDVINYRYEHLLPIVMTSNLRSDALKEYLGGAVWSRLCEMCSGVMTKGKDYRQDGQD
ncbi:MAG: ATP-binding protein [Acutalibacteraceae bacterium]|nr:ATP-binding protein [Acutalibacteraceae bacterium]